MYLRNYWYIAAPISQVTRQLLARTLLGEPVLLYRKLDGRVAAIEDRCIHRRVSLSLGRLLDDRIQCTYHGLEFDSSGRCVRIPGQERVPEKLGVKAYPVAERDGFVWIWMGRPEYADAADIPHFFMISSPEYVGGGGDMKVACNYMLAIENILDLSHIPYMHPGPYKDDPTSKYPARVRVEPHLVSVTRVMPNVNNAPLYQKAMGIYGNVDRTQEIRYWPGCNLQMHSTFRPAGASNETRCLNITIYAHLVPETDRSIFLYVGMFRDFSIENEELTQYISRQIVATFLEDKAILENQQANWDGGDRDRRMLDLAVDRGPLEARRMVEQLGAMERQRS